MSILSRTRVLVIDDEAEMVDLLSLMLRDKNIDILTALNGRSGLQMALRQKPDVILTDLMMPEIDGFTLMEQVLKEMPQVPVIVITAYGSMNTAIRALRLGAFDFLLKPLGPESVKATVAKAAGQQLSKKVQTWRQRITSALSGSRDPDHIAGQFLSLTAQALGAEHGLIWWPEPPPPPLSLNPDDEALHDPLINWATTAGMIHPAGGQHPTAQFAAALNPADGASFAGSVVGLPLYTHNTTHCVLLLAHPQPRYFDRQDLEFLKSLAPFAALAIDNAKTYIHLENSNQRLSTLQSINALTYNAELPLNRVLRLAVEGIRQNMGYPAVILCLPEENSHSLLIRAASGALDKFLRRRGDTPTRRIAFPLNDDSNPFSKSFAAKKIQSAPVQTWATALQQAQALDMAGALSGQKTSRCIALPLWRGEKVIGLLVVGREDPAPPTGDEQAMLTSLANQIAMVVTNASLYQAEQQGRREMEALYRAGLVITSTLSHAEVLKAIIRQIVDLTFVESCIIGRWDEVKEVEVIELHLQKTPAGWLEKVPSGTAYPLSERPLVWQTLQTQTLTTIRGDDPSLPPAEQEWMAAENAALRLILPLLIRDKSIGVIELITTQTGHVFSEHIIRLARGLAAQAAIALENARLHEAEVKRIEQEMDLAQRIQISLLPHETPKVSGLSIAARSVSARLVGGDFYRYLSLPNEKFGVVVGDVSGKGVPSALFMAITITAMDTEIRQQTSPGRMLYRLNQVLHPRMQANGMNTGLLVAVFDPEQHNLQIANAGMIAPLVKQKQSSNWLDVSGFPVGAAPQTTYRSKTISLTGDTTIILASDGILEAKNQAGEMFGFERFQQSVQQIPAAAGSQEILDHIWRDASSYIQGAEPHDDMTLVVVQAANHS